MPLHQSRSLRAVLVLSALCALQACNREASAAEDEYEIVNGARLQLDPYAKCDAAKRVKDAWLKAGDKEEYERWSMTAFNDCAAARR